MELKKFTRISMLLALSVILNIIESFIPIFNGIIPGFKIGFANTIIILVIYIYSFKEAMYISILRVFLVGILRTGLFSVSFFFSLGGALLSVTMMYLAKRFTKLSVIGVSIVGAIFHSLGQIIIAIIFFNINMIYYLPFILIMTIPSGIVIGVIGKELVNLFENRLKYL